MFFRIKVFKKKNVLVYHKERNATDSIIRTKT